MRRTASVVTAALFTTALGVAVGAPAQATASPPGGSSAAVRTSPYVALGDSYSSAAGVTPLVPGAPATCSRSTLSFAHVIAARTHASSFTDVTCSGARTRDFFGAQAPGVAPQLDAVTRQTKLVTMTIGGNDEGVFVDSFFGCAAVSASDVQGNPCEQKYGKTFLDKIVNQTYPHLVAALTAVRKKAPSATVAILGYPRILPATGELSCYASVPIAMGDVPWLNRQQERLNDVVRRAAAATGATYVDMAWSSRGHDACQPVGQRWIEPAVGPVNAFPIHPNAEGEAAMARATIRQLGL